MSQPPEPLRFRRGTDADLVALRDLERTASVAALGHVFPPERYPYPDDDVLARWRLVLDEPGVHVLVVDADDGACGLACLVAHDARTVRHLAVDPRLWGRGVGRRALGRGVDGIRAAGAATSSLWCLAENHRARGLYEHLGWRATGATQDAPWAPYPTEMEYALGLGADRLSGPGAP